MAAQIQTAPTIRHPGHIRSHYGELPIQQIGGHRQTVLGVRRRLEFLLLAAAQAQLLANPFDAVDAYLDAVIREIRLQTFWSAGLAGPRVDRPDFRFQPVRTSKFRAFICRPSCRLLGSGWGGVGRS